MKYLLQRINYNEFFFSKATNYREYKSEIYLSRRLTILVHGFLETISIAQEVVLHISSVSTAYYLFLYSNVLRV